MRYLVRAKGERFVERLRREVGRRRRPSRAMRGGAKKGGSLMANRRQFLRAAGSAAALAAFGARAQAPARREVRIGGKRVKVVDIHAHCAFREVGRLPAANAPRIAPPTLVLGPERIAEMDARGIDIQALSVNAYWWYSADR